MRNKARVFEQLHAAAVEHRQQIPVKIALRFLRYLVSYAVNPEAFARPLSPVAIASDSVDLIAFEQLRKFFDDAIRAKREVGVRGQRRGQRDRLCHDELQQGSLNQQSRRSGP